MREIKFRAWDNKNKEMLEDGLVALDSFNNDNWFDGEDLEYMQYTGLKDKNGKEIYEGDVIKWEQIKQDHIQEIKWDYQELAAMQMGTEIFKNIEVVGNIYENPKLIK